MEKLPLTPRQNRKVPSYDATGIADTSSRLQEIPEQAEEKKCVLLEPEYDGIFREDNAWASKMKRKKWKRRQSSEGSLIHITGTGTLYEETLNCGDCYKVKESSQEFEEFHPGVAQYDDFHTIDSLQDLARDRYRHRYISRKMEESTCNMMSGYYDKVTGWICVFLVGVSAGSVAGFIDIGEGWMKDLKDGVCPQAFWLNKEQCCWSSNRTYYEGDECDQWASWNDLLQLKGTTITEEYVLSYSFYVGWSLLFGALACTMVKTFAPYACGSGIPEIKTILSGFIMRGYLGKWTLIIKSVSIMLAVSAGLSLGKEGPLVHIVCCIGNIISYFFPKYGKNEAKKREILSAAAAAGVSVAFGAPIGGVLFSLEEVSYYFPLKTLWRSFFCALVAAFVLRSIDPFGTDHVVKFYMNSTRPWILIELVPFIMLGALGGVIGTIFIKANIAWSRFRKTSRLGQYPISEVLLVTFLTAVINYPNEFTRINASDLIKTLFSQCGLHDISPLCDYKRNSSSLDQHMNILEPGPGIYRSLYLLLLALACKLIITIFTFGIKIPAGLFIPSLAMGAITGRILGVGMQQLAIRNKDIWPFKAACSGNEDCMSPGLYAMIGSAACLAGVTRMTVSLVVIMFELTGSVDYILPLMATVVVSKWVGDAIFREGIYDAHINLNQYPFLDTKKSFKHSTTAVDLVTTKAGLFCLSQKGMTLGEIEELLKNTNHNGFPVIASKEEPHLIGYVLRRDLCLTIEHMRERKPNISGKSQVDFSQRTPEKRSCGAVINLSRIVDLAPITVSIQMPMETVIEMFCKLGLRQTLVIDQQGRLIDIITKKDVLNHIQELNRKMEEKKTQGKK